jgi:hypothetical protein
VSVFSRTGLTPLCHFRYSVIVGEIKLHWLLAQRVQRKTYNMKTMIKTCATTLLLTVAGVGALGLMTGCETRGYQKSDAASRSYQDAAYEVQAESRTLDTTVASLNSLVNQPAADLKPQYERFNQCLYQLENAETRNEHAATRIAARNAQYLETWNKELTNMSFEAIRARSEARKTEVTTHFETVDRRYSEVRSTTGPLIDYLNDIRRALSTDLTPSGLESIKPIVVTANDSARKVQEALGRLSTELAASSASMSSVTYQVENRPREKTVEATAQTANQ